VGRKGRREARRDETRRDDAIWDLIRGRCSCSDTPTGAAEQGVSPGGSPSDRHRGRVVRVRQEPGGEDPASPRGRSGGILLRPRVLFLAPPGTFLSGEGLLFGGREATRRRREGGPRIRAPRHATSGCGSTVLSYAVTI